MNHEQLIAYLAEVHTRKMRTIGWPYDPAETVIMEPEYSMMTWTPKGSFTTAVDPGSYEVTYDAFDDALEPIEVPA